MGFCVNTTLEIVPFLVIKQKTNYIFIDFF